MLDPTDPFDLLFQEILFPGSMTGSTEVECPHCHVMLTVPVNDPMGTESYRCCKCDGEFDVDWGDGMVRFHAQ